MKPNNVWSFHFKLEVFIWRHVVYASKSFNIIRGILICVIVRSRDVQKYIVYVQYCIIMEITYCIWNCIHVDFQITTISVFKVMSSNLVHCELYSIQRYVIELVSDLPDILILLLPPINTLDYHYFLVLASEIVFPRDIV